MGMKRSYLIAGGLAVAGSTVLCVFVVTRSAKPTQPNLRESGRGADEVGSASDDPVDGLQDEVRRLRAEVKAKDNLIKLISAQSRVAGEESDSAATPSPSPDLDHMVRVCGVLDERIMTAPVDTPGSDEMKRALQEIIDSGVLGQTVVTSLSCSGTMCKIALTGESDAAVNSSTKAMVAHAPKLFAATMAYTTKPGERAIYLAKSRDDLAVDFDEETEE
jgi:hypothetical protein